MRNDLHPLLVAPSVGDEVRVRVNEGLVEGLVATGQSRAATRAESMIRSGEHTAPATVVLGIGRAVSLPSGEQFDVCAPEHLMHLRCEPLAGDELLTVSAGDCDLDVAPSEADAALGL